MEARLGLQRPAAGLLRREEAVGGALRMWRSGGCHFAVGHKKDKPVCMIAYLQCTSLASVQRMML